MHEMISQLEENEETTLRLEELIHKANAKIMALDRKCDSQAREIVRLNSQKMETSSNFLPHKNEQVEKVNQTMLLNLKPH